MASGSKESPSNNPGLAAEIDQATKGYFMQQTVNKDTSSHCVFCVLYFCGLIVGCSLNSKDRGTIVLKGDEIVSLDGMALNGGNW